MRLTTPAEKGKMRTKKGLRHMADTIDLRERTLASREIFDGKILHVFEDTVRLPDGQTATREYLRHVGAVCIVPLFENGDVLIERQFRYPIGRVVTEIPAGKLDSPTEDRLAAAQRELHEETGAAAASWRSLGLFQPAFAYSDETIEMFLAEGLTFGTQELDADEFLQLDRVPLEALVQDILDGKILDAKTQLAILKTKLLLERDGRV